MEKMKFETPNLTNKNIDKIAELFPNVITEAADENGNIKKAVNFDMLRQLLSGDIAEGDEAYEFTWVGKKAAIAEANRPIRKTLRPCPEESVNWDTTENLYIEGDNLEVLKLLQESYLGKVKMIYIDPPYNTGNDFIYCDDFKMSAEEYSEEIGEYDEEGDRLFKNTDSNGRFHSDWCSMIYSRLLLARNLLSDDGVIFISIDDNEQENLKKICDEVFGESNFVATFPWRKRTAKSDVPFGVSQDYEWVVCFAKSDKFQARVKSSERIYFETDDFPNRPWRIHDLTKQTTASERPNSNFTMINPKTGKEYPVNPNRTWAITKETFEQYYAEGRIVFPDDYDFLNISKPAFRYFRDDDMKKAGDMFGYKPASTNLPDTIGMSLNGTKEIIDIFGGKIFSFPKPVELIKYFIYMSTKPDENAIILDFFSGSSTSAEAVMKMNLSDFGNRRFIQVQIPETIDRNSDAFKYGYKNMCAIGKERIRKVGSRIKEDLQKSGNILKQVAEQERDNPNLAIYSATDYEYSNESKTIANEFDVGFRVLKIDESNMREVYYSPAEYDQTMLDDMESNIKPDRTSLDLLFGCLLDWGLPLSMPYSSEEIEGMTVHTYNGGDLIACFDENIPESVITTLAKRKPLRAVFRDSSFADSPAKINVFEIFKLYAPETRVKVI